MRQTLRENLRRPCSSAVLRPISPPHQPMARPKLAAESSFPAGSCQACVPRQSAALPPRAQACEAWRQILVVSPANLDCLTVPPRLPCPHPPFPSLTAHGSPEAMAGACVCGVRCRAVRGGRRLLVAGAPAMGRGSGAWGRRCRGGGDSARRGGTRHAGVTRGGVAGRRRGGRGKAGVASPSPRLAGRRPGTAVLEGPSAEINTLEM